MSDLTKQQNHSTSCASFNFEIFNFKNFTCPFGLRHEIHYPSSRNRDFRAAEGLGGGQVGDPVELVNVTETEYMYKYNGFEYQDELGHAQSHFMYGAVKDEIWYTQYGPDGNPQEVRKDEVYATFIENKLRKENGLHLRTHYSTESKFKVNENSRILHKVKGNWIMTPDAKIILNAIQSPSNRK